MTVDRMAIDPMVRRTGFCPAMEATATVLGVELAKAQATTKQESLATESEILYFLLMYVDKVFIDISRSVDTLIRT